MAAGFFKEARVALQEEDVEEEVEGEGAEIYECGEEAPVLFAGGVSRVIGTLGSRGSMERMTEGADGPGS